VFLCFDLRDWDEIWVSSGGVGAAIFWQLRRGNVCCGCRGFRVVGPGAFGLDRTIAACLFYSVFFGVG